MRIRIVILAALLAVSSVNAAFAQQAATLRGKWEIEVHAGRVVVVNPLDGTPAGEVTDENRQHAAELLRERFKKQIEQRKAAEATVKAAEAAAKAEQLRAAKLSQLAEKFARR